MTTTTKTDAITLLMEDHRIISRHIDQLNHAPQERREELFFMLTQRIMAHEAAEEFVIYPALRDLPGGNAVADRRVAEQAAGEKALLAIDRLHPTSVDFARDVREVTEQLKQHASNEEVTAFPILRDNLTHDQLVDLGDRYTKAKATAPTHPHPHVPHTELSNKLLGPMVAKFDRVRDRLRHPERKATRPGVPNKPQRARRRETPQQPEPAPAEEPPGATKRSGWLFCRCWAASQPSPRTSTRRSRGPP